MPLSKKGSKILGAMEGQYGPEKGKQVFYASINAGKIHGAEKTVGNNPMPTAGSRQPHGYRHSHPQGKLRVSGDPKAHQLGKR